MLHVQIVGNIQTRHGSSSAEVWCCLFAKKENWRGTLGVAYPAGSLQLYAKFASMLFHRQLITLCALQLLHLSSGGAHNDGPSFQEGTPANAPSNSQYALASDLQQVQSALADVTAQLASTRDQVTKLESRVNDLQVSCKEVQEPQEAASYIPRPNIFQLPIPHCLCSNRCLQVPLDQKET